MRIRSSIWIICGCVLAILICVISFRSGRIKTPLQSSQDVKLSPTSNRSSSVPIVVNSIPPAASSGAARSQSIEVKSEAIKKALSEFNDDEIEFYGRVVDQKGAAVPDALVSAAVQINNGVRVGTDRFSVQSDQGGNFTIAGRQGKSLALGVSKAGYVMVATNSYFIFSHLWSESERHKPNPNEPTILRMHRLLGPQPLSKIDSTLRAKYSNEPFFFDVSLNQFSTDKGDLRILVNRSSGTLNKQSPGDWSVTLEPVAGGLIESDIKALRVTLEAPEAGYTNLLTISMKQNDPAWMDNFQKAFFLKSHDGAEFSKLSCDFMINDKPDDKVFIQIRGVANLNGSRNWEDSVGMWNAF
jgi:hypothetical protein